LGSIREGRITHILVAEMIEIVPIAPAHIESFHRTLDFVARERRYLALLEAPPLESMRGFVADIIRKGHPQFVAVSEGEVVGWCDALPKARPIHAHVGVVGMGLLPAFRGRGMGRRLLGKTLEAARALGLSRIELTVREDNAGAIALYQRIGFVAEGVQRNAFKVDGQYQNLVMMALLF
jgi:RimJ/RimL family protein N-acetyltransferase